jgi:hypothetical protein
MAGIYLRTLLPSTNFDHDSEQTVRLAMGVVAAMATFVLGLLVSSSKAAYDLNHTELTQMASQMILLDRLLANYGPGAQQVRDSLRNYLIQQINRMWPHEKDISLTGPPPMHGEEFYHMVEKLSPGDGMQKVLRDQAMATMVATGKLRWLFYVQRAVSVPTALVVIMISWLTLVFISFGIFSPHSWSAVGSMLIAAVCVSAAIFLILELYAPFSGLIRIPSASVRAAIDQLGK